MIDQIERLGQEVEASWKEKGYAKEAFSTIALEALQRNQIHEQFTLKEFLEWLRKTKTLPEQ